MAFPQNPVDKQRYRKYTYDAISKSWKQDFIYQEQIDFGSGEDGINAADIPILGREQTIQDFILDIESFLSTGALRRGSSENFIDITNASITVGSVAATGNITIRSNNTTARTLILSSDVELSVI